MAPRDRRWRRRAQCADGAAQGLLMSADLPSTPTRRSQKGRELADGSGGRRGLPLEVAQAAGTPARTGRTGCGCRGRCLFRDPRAALADRRLGEHAIGAARKPPRVRKAFAAMVTARKALSTRCQRPPPWGRLPPRAARGSSAARPTLQAARPRRDFRRTAPAERTWTRNPALPLSAARKHDPEKRIPVSGKDHVLKQWAKA